MRYKDPNNVSKQKILLESFKLFATKPFSDITFTDIEKVTGLSRGAILYHFKSKDEILASIIDRFIINKEYDLPTIDVSKSMWDNIKNFIAVKQRQQEFFTSIGIQNINRAFIYIAANCMNLLKEIPNETQQRLEKEKKYWKELLLLGIEKQEIKNSVNVEVEKLSFMEIYYGYSYMSMTTPNGYDTNCLLEKFQHLNIKTQKQNFYELRISSNSVTRLNPKIGNPLCIDLPKVNEANMYTYTNPRTGIQYIYDTENKIAFSHYTDDLDGDWILDDYGIRSWVESLPTKSISMATLANSYRIIGL